MKRFVRIAALIGVTALAAAATFGAAATAQDRSTPNKWNYEIKDGKRVPKSGNRLTNPDGSWREETKLGSCVTIKEKSASGEYKESRRCD